MKTSHKYNKIKNIITIQLFVTQAFQCKEWNFIGAEGVTIFLTEVQKLVFLIIKINCKY